MRRICAFFQKSCAFCHKSVKLGAVLGEHLKNIFSYGDILKLSCVAFGSHFLKWPPYKYQNVDVLQLGVIYYVGPMQFTNVCEIGQYGVVSVHTCWRPDHSNVLSTPDSK